MDFELYNMYLIRHILLCFVCRATTLSHIIRTLTYIHLPSIYATISYIEIATAQKSFVLAFG